MYVKIFAGILKSSIAADTPLRRFFMDLLLIADRDGYVIATRSAIAKDLGIDRSEVDWGLERLMQPDPESGNPENDGRRIEAVDGRGYGWKILNYGFYRDVKSAEDLRSAHARRQAEYRERQAAKAAAAVMRDKSDNHVTPQAQAQAHAQQQEQEPRARDETGKPEPEPPLISELARQSTIAPTVPGLVCKGLLALGITRVNPSHPSLLALLDAGVQCNQIVDTARELLAANPTKPPSLAYVCATVRGRLSDATKPGARVTPQAKRPAREPDVFVAPKRDEALIARRRAIGLQNVSEVLEGYKKGKL